MPRALSSNSHVNQFYYRRIKNCPSSSNKTNVKEMKEMEQRASISIGEKPVPKAINLRSFFLTLFGKEIKKI